MLSNRLFSSIFEVEALLNKLLNEGELIINWGRCLKNKGNAVNAIYMRDSLSLKTTLSFDLVRVVDSKGNVLIDLRRQVLHQAKLYDQILVSQALSAVDLSSIVAVEKPAPSILVGTAPIKSPTGVIGAVIVGNAVSDRLLEQISQGTDKYIAAFNQGKMIASTLPNSTQWQAPPQQGTSRINIGTNSYITKTVILSGLDNAELKLVLLIPLAPLMKAKQKLWITIGFFSIMGVAVATAVGFWVAGAIARPITQVTEATERLASGILTTRLPVISSDELGQLAQGFNSMVEQLATLRYAIAFSTSRWNN